MKEFSDLKEGKDRLAISNMRKIREWIFKNFDREKLSELYSNGAHGQFNQNGYYYSWGASKEFGIHFGVGANSLINSRPTDYGTFDIKDGEFYYKMGDSQHYGAITDNWPFIKSTMLRIQEKLKNRERFEP